MVRADSHTEITWPVPLESFEVETITVATGEVLAILRGRSETQEHGVVLRARRGRPEVLWEGRLDLHGDPGERVAELITTDDRTGDGHPDLVVGQRREGASLCDETPIAIASRAYDPRSGILRPVALRIGVGEVQTLRSPDQAAVSGEPLVRSLFVVGASDRSDPVALTRALTDSEASSAWTPSSQGESALVFRYGARRPVHAVRIDAGPIATLPEAIRWMTESGAFRIEVGSGASTAWMVPPEPIDSACWVLLVGEGPGSTNSGSVAEVRFFSDLDTGDGVETLIAELIRGGSEGERAAGWLGQLGDAAIAPLTEAWERLEHRGRLATVRLVASLSDARATALLVRAAGDDDSEVRQEALNALAERRAVGELLGLLRAAALASERLDGDGSKPRIEALSEALASATTEALAGEVPIEQLWEILAREGASEIPQLRAAAANFVAVHPEGPTALESWMTQASPTSLASLALGLSEAGPSASVPLIETALPAAEAFADRYRLALAIANLSPELRTDPMDAWVATQASEAEEWMIRAEVIRAADPELARRALRDAYPRVRLAAARALGDDDAVVPLVQTDPWPLVRRAALEEHPELATEALDDDAPSVRQRAITLLTRAERDEAWPAIRARLLDDQEWPFVTRVATHFAETLCVQDAGPALAEVVRRGASSNAWQPYIDEAAYALYVALTLGERASADARRIALRSENPRLIAILDRPAPAPCATDSD